jgi:hypothetical protein
MTNQQHDLSTTLATLRRALVERQEFDWVRVPVGELHTLLETFGPAQPSELEQAAREEAKARFFTASEHVAVVRLRDLIVELGAAIELLVPADSVPRVRQKALALTALEDVQMRANRGLFAPAEPARETRGEVHVHLTGGQA